MAEFASVVPLKEMEYITDDVVRVFITKKDFDLLFPFRHNIRIIDKDSCIHFYFILGINLPDVDGNMFVTLRKQQEGIKNNVKSTKI